MDRFILDRVLIEGEGGGTLNLKEPKVWAVPWELLSLNAPN